MVAFVVLVTLIVFAVWAAYAIPGQTPARVPENAAVPPLGTSSSGPAGTVVARAGTVDIMLPVAPAATTAVAYHPVDNPNTVPFSPVGERLGGGGLGEKLSDIFAGGGGIRYYLMDGIGGEGSSSTAGLDVGAVPGSPVVSPVNGKISAVRRYRILGILGRYTDTEIDIQVADDPSLLLVVTHLASPKAHIGDAVTRGETVLGALRAMPAGLDQALSRYTSDSGDHVQLVMLRVTPDLAGP